MESDDAASEAAAGPGEPGTVAQCHAVIAELKAQNLRLQEQLALLVERLKLDSRNSSKPPSSGGLGRGKRIKRYLTAPRVQPKRITPLDNRQAQR